MKSATFLVTTVNPCQCRRIMKKMGMSLKKCAGIPAKADPQLQFDFYTRSNNFIKEVASECGIELLFLPAYSPNLNLIERLWKLTKKRCLTNKYYKNFDMFVGGIDACLDSLSTTLRTEVVSLLSLNFQFFKNPNS